MPSNSRQPEYCWENYSWNSTPSISSWDCTSCQYGMFGSCQGENDPTASCRACESLIDLWNASQLHEPHQDFQFGFILDHCQNSTGLELFEYMHNGTVPCAVWINCHGDMNSSCGTNVIAGCMDPTAINYNSNANVECYKCCEYQVPPPPPPPGGEPDIDPDGDNELDPPPPPPPPPPPGTEIDPVIPDRRHCKCDFVPHPRDPGCYPTQNHCQLVGDTYIWNPTCRSSAEDEFSDGLGLNCVCDCIESDTLIPDEIDPLGCQCQYINCRTDCDDSMTSPSPVNPYATPRCCLHCCGESDPGTDPIVNTCSCTEDTSCNPGYVWCPDFGCQLIGDVNMDGVVNVTDIVEILQYILSAGSNPWPGCIEQGDVNGDGVVNILDVTTIINCILHPTECIEVFSTSQYGSINLGDFSHEYPNKKLSSILKEHLINLQIIAFNRDKSPIHTLGLMLDDLETYLRTHKGTELGYVKIKDYKDKLQVQSSIRTDCVLDNDLCSPGYYPVCNLPEDEDSVCGCTCVQHEELYTCTDQEACNYNEICDWNDLCIDDGSCWYANNEPFCDCEYNQLDCNGDCGGNAEIDNCGVCSGGNTNHVPNSDMDACGQCFTNFVQDEHGNCCNALNMVMVWDDPDCDGLAVESDSYWIGCYGCLQGNCPDFVCSTMSLGDTCEGSAPGYGVVDVCLTCFPDTHPDDIASESYPEGWNQCIGCIDPVACNYVGLDLLYVCQPGTLPGQGGFCIDAGGCEYAQTCYDCDGNCTCPGDDGCPCGVYEDECGVCGGPGIVEGICDCNGNVEDCLGECGGDAEIDECGVCGGDGKLDYCWDADGDEIGAGDSISLCPAYVADNFPCTYGTAGFCTTCGDADDDCAGNSYDCLGVCGGTAVLNTCGTCVPAGGEADNDGLPCNDGCTDFPEGACDCDGGVLGCDGVCGSGNVLDECNICAGLNVVCNSGTWGTSECPNMDCEGTCFGDKVIDECGECTDTPGVVGCMDESACNYNPDASCNSLPRGHGSEHYIGSKYVKGVLSAGVNITGAEDLEGSHFQYTAWPWISGVKAPYTISLWFRHPNEWTWPINHLNMGQYKQFYFENHPSSGNLTVTMKHNYGGVTATDSGTDPVTLDFEDLEGSSQANMQWFFPYDTVGNTTTLFGSESNREWINLIMVVKDNEFGSFTYDMYINGIKGSTGTGPGGLSAVKDDIQNTFIDFEDLRCLSLNSTDGDSPGCDFDEYVVWDTADVYNPDTGLFDQSYSPRHYWMFGEHEKDTPNDAKSAEWNIKPAVTVDAAWMDRRDELIGNDCSVGECLQEFTDPNGFYYVSTPGLQGCEDWYQLPLADIFNGQTPILYQGYQLTFEATVPYDPGTGLQKVYLRNSTQPAGGPDSPCELSTLTGEPQGYTLISDEIGVNGEYTKVGINFFAREKGNLPGYQFDCQAETIEEYGNCISTNPIEWTDNYSQNIFTDYMHLMSTVSMQYRNLQLEHLPGRIYLHRKKLSGQMHEMEYHGNFYETEARNENIDCYYCFNNNCDGYPNDYYNCDGSCVIGDSDNDGICDGIDDFDCEGDWLECGCEKPWPVSPQVCSCPVDYDFTCVSQLDCLEVYGIGHDCIDYQIGDAASSKVCAQVYDFCGVCGGGGILSNCGGLCSGDLATPCLDNMDCGNGDNGYCFALDSGGNWYCGCKGTYGAEVDVCPIHDCAGNCGFNQDGDAAYLDDCGDCYCPAEVYPQPTCGGGSDMCVCNNTINQNMDTCGWCPTDDNYGLDECIDYCGEVYPDGDADTDWNTTCCVDDSDDVCNFGEAGGCEYNQVEDGLCCRKAFNHNCDGTCAVAGDCNGVCGGWGVELTCYQDSDGDGLGDPTTITTTCHNPRCADLSTPCIPGDGTCDGECQWRCDAGWVLNNDDVNDDNNCASNTWDSCGECDGICYEVGVDCETYASSGVHRCRCDDEDGNVFVPDVCGVCGGDNSTCDGCTIATACNYNADAIVACNSGSENDCCTYPTAPNDCGGNCCTAGNTNPECDYHGAGYEVDFDCAGVCNGGWITDQCGVCRDAADVDMNSTCTDCAGYINGSSYFDPNCGGGTSCVCGSDADGNPIPVDTNGCVASPCTQDCSGEWGGDKEWKECCDYITTGVKRCLPLATDCGTIVECGCTYPDASNTDSFTGGEIEQVDVGYGETGACTFSCQSNSLQCWYEDNDGNGTPTYYDDYATFIDAACGGTGGWCESSSSWFTETECIVNYADILAPDDFIFFEDFYAGVTGSYDQIKDFGNGYEETRTWQNLDNWLTGDWYNDTSGDYSADWPVGVKSDLLTKLDKTKDALVKLGAGSDWGNDVWCKAQYGLLDSDDISNCTTDDAYCSYSTQCLIYDGDDGGSDPDFMGVGSCLNWCDGLGSCVACPPNPNNTDNCYYSNCLPGDGCHGGNLDGTCYDTVTHMVETDCIPSYACTGGNLDGTCYDTVLNMMEADCIPSYACTGGNLDGTCYDTVTHMVEADCIPSYTCTGGNLDGTCYDTVTHMVEADCIPSYTCTGGNLDGTCYDTVTHMVEADCTISYGDVCASNTCFTSASHFDFQDGALCASDNGYGGVCQSISEYCEGSEIGGDCNQACWDANCDTWCTNDADWMLETDCNPSYTCDDSAGGENGTCFDSDTHMFKNACDAAYVCDDSAGGENGTCFDSDTHMFENACDAAYVCDDLAGGENGTCFDSDTHMFENACIPSYACTGGNLDGTCYDTVLNMAEADCIPSYTCTGGNLDGTCYDTVLNMVEADCIPSYACTGGNLDGTCYDTVLNMVEADCIPSYTCTGGNLDGTCYDTVTHMVEADCIPSYACTGGFLNGDCYDTNLHMLESDCTISYGDVCASDTCFDSNVHIEKDDITVDYCTNPDNIYNSSGELVSTQLYTSASCTSDICSQTAPDDFTFLSTFYTTPGTYSDGTDDWTDLDAWILASGSADSYLGDTLTAHCIGTDVNGDGLYNDQTWCTNTYSLDTTWCQSSFTLIPAIVYSEYTLTFDTNNSWNIVSYPLVPEFKNNINTSDTCNILTILENSYSGTLQVGDKLLLSFGGGAYQASYNSPGNWNNGSTLKTTLESNPGAGLVFKTSDTGSQTITWSLDNLTGCV